MRSLLTGHTARFSWATILLLPLTIALTALLTAPFILLTGASPLEVYHRYLVVPLASSFTLLEVLVSSTPLLFTGAAVALAFRAGYWNIGAEGQLLTGAIAAAWVGTLVGELPALAALPLMVVAGAIAGALWALGPALLRVRLGIDEVVTTLLLNPVALLLVNALLHGPWRDPVSGFPESERIAAAAQFPALVERSRLHLGFLVALVIIFVTWFVITRTPAGVKLRAAGLSPRAASFAGINVNRTLLGAALASGAIAGIAGASEIAGIQYRLTSGVSPGFGYTGIVVATLGGLSMPGVTLAALVLGDLRVGAGAAGRTLGVPSQLGDIIQAALLLATVALLALHRYGGLGPIVGRLGRRQREQHPERAR
ncbi:MAG TPA: ABC transporter permease [Candidatus Caenarcaniphilales bacterium]|nr:ABC transporter permease [Candidatus Caenarcaniphilales bacterium]